VPARPAVLPLAAAAAVLLAACSSEVAGTASPPQGPSGETEFVRGGGCGEVFLWAASESGEVVVGASVDVVGRPAGEPSEYTVELPDPDVLVTVRTGTGDLTENLCTDVILGPEPTLIQDAVAGTVHLTVDPPGEDCGDSEGRLRIEGLVAEDGTEFGPIEAETGLVGCNVGG
jgi:hypothetical protein